MLLFHLQKPFYRDHVRHGAAGIEARQELFRLPFTQAVPAAFVQTGVVVVKTLEGLGQVLRGKLGLMSGPVGIVSDTGEQVRAGVAPTLWTLVLISLGLAKRRKPAKQDPSAPPAAPHS